MKSVATLPDPLAIAPLPELAPEAEGNLVLAQLAALRAQVLAGRVAEPFLADVRFTIYQYAAVSWGDPWRVARVADFEEWVAAWAVSCDDLATAWHAWRAGFWIRHLLKDQPGGPELWAHAERVMALLSEASGRSS